MDASDVKSKAVAYIVNIVAGHRFNRRVLLLQPTTTATATATATATPTTCDVPTPRYYKVQTQLHELLTPAFLDAHIRKGSLTALSQHAKLASDNVVAVLPPGVLLLALNASTHAELGVTGKQLAVGKPHLRGTAATKTASKRFVYSVNVASAAFQPGKTPHDRLMRCLGGEAAQAAAHADSSGGAGGGAGAKAGDKAVSGRTAPVDLLMLWVDAAGRYQDMVFPSDCSTSMHVMEPTCSTMPTLQTPDLAAAAQASRQQGKQGKQRSSGNGTAQAVLTWLGGVACGLSQPTRSTTRDLQECGKGFLACTLQSKTWQGFLDSTHVWRCLLEAQRAVAAGLPWAAVMVWGFPNAPVAWGDGDEKRQHEAALAGGHNDFVIVVLPSNELWLLRTSAILVAS